MVEKNDSMVARESDPLRRDFEGFMLEVRKCLSGDASSKGYNDQGPDGDNHLFAITGPNHAVGELIYKAIRYQKKGDPVDMVKAAAWAFLVWKNGGPK